MEYFFELLPSIYISNKKNKGTFIRNYIYILNVIY